MLLLILIIQLSPLACPLLTVLCAFFCLLQVCYYYNGDPRTIYERLGHAEVVQVALSDEQTAAQQEFR